jgi:hypothetical protein
MPYSSSRTSYRSYSLVLFSPERLSGTYGACERICEAPLALMMTKRGTKMKRRSRSGSWHRKRLRPGRNPDPGPPGVSPRYTDVHVITAGLHASAAMGLSGRLEFDSSNHGLC